MWSASLFQTVSGAIGPRLNFEAMSWSIDLNDTESISMTLKKSDLPKVDLKYWLSPWWAGVVIFWDGCPVVAGPIITRPSEQYDSIKITCGGIRTLLARRLVTLELSDWTNLAKSNIQYKGLSLGTIAKRVVVQAQNKLGGSLPITFAVPDETAAMDADHERNYRGFNVQNIDCDAILTKLSNVINGPDIMFRPVLVRDNQLTFEMWTGTEKQPRIYQPITPVWDSTAVESNISNLQTTTTGTHQTSRTYSVGAGQDEGTLIRVNTNITPIQRQYPLLETVVSTSQSENPAVVNNHGLSNLVANSEPLVELQMTVRGDGEIPFGQFWPGYAVDVITKGWLSIPDGKNKMRLLNMTGDSSSEVKVALQLDDRYA